MTACLDALTLRDNSLAVLHQLLKVLVIRQALYNSKNISGLRLTISRIISPVSQSGPDAFAFFIPLDALVRASAVKMGATGAFV